MSRTYSFLEKFGILFLGAAFLFVYAISTSPLTSNFWGSDSAFFQAAGQNRNGRIRIWSFFCGRRTDKRIQAANTQWLLLSGLRPYSRYCTTADHFACLSKEIENEIKEMFEDHEPKYIVTNADAEMENQFVKGRIQQDYSRICKNELYALYRLKSLDQPS